MANHGIGRINWARPRRIESDVQAAWRRVTWAKERLEKEPGVYNAIELQVALRDWEKAKGFKVVRITEAPEYDDEAGRMVDTVSVDTGAL